MAVNAAFLQAGAVAQATAFPFLSIHTATPNASGSNESTAARVAAGWATANGVLTATGKSFTGGAASSGAQHVGFWSAATGGTFGGSQPLTGDQSFNAAGQYTINSVTVTPTAT